MDQKTSVLRRVIAWLVDILFLSVFFFTTTYWYSGRWVMRSDQHLWGISDPISLIFLFIIFAYFILMEAYVSWTMGKRILGILLILRSPTGQRFGNRAAGTYVIRYEQR